MHFLFDYMLIIWATETFSLRIRIDNELKVFEPRTSLRKRGEKKGNCSLVGITPAVYVVKDGDEEVLDELIACSLQNISILKTFLMLK